MKNIQLDIQELQEFTINGDANRVIKLNPGDFGIIQRLSDSTEKLNQIMEDYINISVGEEPTEDNMKSLSSQLDALNKKTSEIIDGIFNTNVSEVCLNGGTMLDMKNGEFTFQTILRVLLSLYEDTIAAEAEKLQKKIKKYTAKYVPKDHLKKK